MDKIFSGVSKMCKKWRIKVFLGLALVFLQVIKELFSLLGLASEHYYLYKPIVVSLVAPSFEVCIDFFLACCSLFY